MTEVQNWYGASRKGFLGFNYSNIKLHTPQSIIGVLLERLEGFYAGRFRKKTLGRQEGGKGPKRASDFSSDFVTDG